MNSKWLKDRQEKERKYREKPKETKPFKPDPVLSEIDQIQKSEELDRR